MYNKPDTTWSFTRNSRVCDRWTSSASPLCPPRRVRSGPVGRGRDAAAAATAVDAAAAAADGGECS